MPVHSGIGHSETTIYKQKDFIGIVSMLSKIWKGAIKNQYTSDMIFYYDLNGGSGVSLDNPIAGSPVLSAIILEKSGLDYQGYVSEKMKKNATDLRKIMKGYDGFCVICGDNKTVLKPCLPGEIQKPPYGLIYADPNGTPRNELEFFEYVSNINSCRFIDFLISFGANGIKRAVGKYPNNGHQIDMDRLKDMKNVWFVREFMKKGNQNWCFLLGTNWEGFPAPAHHFHNVDSEKGKDILSFFDNQKEVMPSLVSPYSNQPSLL